ncbi:2-deoxy-D-gluconate 3-dehydrogenase [Exophiala aquamarina CBS 119918]|uniref:2-deoxy-D-gluconate 3-dehydrogenase n=1 Tax=Exophiala aquamarina CBS 119918 TaxID=1182545 RepID=A0A072PPA9_9EURO|nr:2-deoxy-D-gluconate 3-dehydrogenase [Exophiala aquamarina CBS 119918]KEF61939.1 2-deoxy-D-gluconate 3-dehydrogenase [Exophiala aquamarina CBS 119918]
MGDLFGLAGQTAVVTGAARGIGRAMALGLAEAGADIVLILRNSTQQETKDAIEAIGRKCSIYTADLGVPSEIEGLIERIRDEHDFQILVNVAGIQRRLAAHTFPDDAYDEVLQTNLKATFKLCKDTGKYWIDKGIKGCIINTASLASFQGGVNMVAYAASKGGVNMLTKALSNEWAGMGIRVNAVAPGYIATDMNLDTRTNSDTTYYDSITTRIPAGRWGEPDEFKGVVVFLASQASTYLTGQTIVIDGGWMAR